MRLTSLLGRALWFAAGTVAMLVLEASSRHEGRRGSAARLLLDRVRPAPVADDTVELRVRKKLGRVARNPSAIAVAIAHGCVDLRGAVSTHERARIVRAISKVSGVDAVLDLMTEPPALPPRAPVAPLLLPARSALV